MSKSGTRRELTQNEYSALPDSKKLARFRRRALRWYDKHGRSFPWRKASSSKYQCIVAEVLLQRTRAETIAVFFPGFIEEFPSWEYLNAAGSEKLKEFLQPIGLWRRRAITLQSLSQIMIKKNGRFPKKRDKLEALPGIGQYIANAVLLFCHGKAEPLLDGNMARVLERVFGPRKLADIRYDPYLQTLSRRVVNCKNPAKLNWAILDIGALICLPRKALCRYCPLMPICKWFQEASL